MKYSCRGPLHCRETCRERGRSIACVQSGSCKVPGRALLLARAVVDGLRRRPRIAGHSDGTRAGACRSALAACDDGRGRQAGKCMLRSPI
eukprot:957703-Prymnesium_polylepis.1